MMMDWYKYMVRPALFRMDAEKAHEMALSMLRIAGYPALRHTLKKRTCVHGLERNVFGLNFPNPVGLAAGFDKNGVALHGLEALGFGFVSMGTVVPRPQAGNPRTRLFRLEEDRAIINRYGFNSPGVDAVAQNLQECGKIEIPIFISIGANKITLEKAPFFIEVFDDYLACIDKLHPYAAAFALGISSPNTPGLRDLQQREPLSHLCSTVQTRLQEMARKTGGNKKPLLLKIAPDLTNKQFEDALDVASIHVDGLIIANTTLNRAETLRSKHKGEKGGLSGTTEVFERMILLIRHAHWKYPDLPLIAVGGIDSSTRAQRALDSGASLVQVLTGMIYRGPFVAAQINRGLGNNLHGL